ncbi:MAG: serine hydrolase [Ruminococcaceae bacterium]|nr:serine hydrolase [Oscillospiraceae bacterium]
MASKWKNKALELVIGLAFTNKRNPATIPYAPTKTEISEFESKYFRRTTPERCGISSKRIYEMLSALEKNPRANIHNIMILKGKEVISECSAPGYDVNTRHLSHSMSKSLTGMAIGFLVSEKKLSLTTRLIDIFPEYKYTDKRFEDITVHHLLAMSTGVPFSEAGSVTETEWTKAFFESKLLFSPGTNFAYNSMNSYILARIVVRISGMSLTRFLTDRIFKPLAIENVFWEIGPEGIEKGGWGVHLSCESWAKLGVMMMMGGVFEGKKVLPRAWVAKSTSLQMQAPDSAGDFNYGYQIWVHRRNDEFLFNGMLGQNVWVCPRNGIVVVVNCENNELFQKSAVIEIIQRYLGGKIYSDVYDTGSLAVLRKKERTFFESRCYAKPKHPKKGLLYKIGLKNRMPYDSAWNKILGTYTFAQNNHGILPLFIRAMQNNYTGGIESVSFEREGEKLFFTSREGGIDYRLEVGLYEYRSTVLNFNGEKYLIRAMGESAENEDRHKSYKIDIILPEMPNSRKIKFSFGDDGRLLMRMTEIPNDKIAEPLVEGIYTTNPKLAFAVKMLERRLGDRFLNKKLESLFSPLLIGANTHSKKYLDIVADEKARAEEANRATGAISALILKAAESDDD